MLAPFVEANVKRLLFLLILSLSVALTATCSPAPDATPTPSVTATPSPDRHFEPSGGFSYVPPVGWEVTESSQIPYKVAIGPAEDGFAANITIVDEPFAGSLEEYVSASIKSMSEFFQGFQLVGQDEVTVEGGATGAKIVVENEQSERKLRQTFYILDAGEKMLVITCTRLSSSSEELDAVCEGSVQTFRFESE
jgi:hypothetical protein